MGIIAGATVVVNSVTLPAVKSCNWEGLGRDSVEVTSFDSNGWRQYVAGLKEPGTLSVECEYIPDNAQQKYASGGALYGFYSQSAVQITVAWPNSAGGTTTWMANGFLTGAPVTGNVGDTLKITFTYKLTGAVNLEYTP